MGRKSKNKKNKIKAKKHKEQIPFYKKNFVLNVIYHIPIIYISIVFKIYLAFKNFIKFISSRISSYSVKAWGAIRHTVTDKKEKKHQYNLLKTIKNIALFEIKFPIKPVLNIFYKLIWPLRMIWKFIRWILAFEIRIRIFSLKTIAFVTVVILSYVFSLLYIAVFEDIPSPDTLAVYDPRLTTTIYDRKGNVLYRVYDDEDRIFVGIHDVPQQIINATIAIEDQSFFEHSGLSIRGIARAAQRTFLEESMEGGSTITQQLIKNTILTPERTYERKMREAVLALEVERRYTKDQILEMYLNKISYGGTAYGIRSAANKYFSKELNELTLAETAFLAGLPAAPSRYSPYSGNIEAGKIRQRTVLQRMVTMGFISAEEAREAYIEELQFQNPIDRIVAPHFVHYVIGELEKKYGQMLVMQGGLDVFTSIDLELQAELEQIVRRNVNGLARNNVTNGGALITNPKTGEILAMVGSTDYWNIESEGNFNVTTSLRQPGSSIKPLTYSLALETGAYQLGSIIQDTPVSYPLPGQAPYTPVNYDGRFRGPLTFKSALAGSYNIPAVKILDTLSVNNLVEHGKRMGITTWGNSSRFGLSLTLGAGEVKMTDMAVMYGVFANHGYKKELSPILKVYDSFGNVLDENDCVNFLQESPSILTNRAIFETRAVAADYYNNHRPGSNGIACTSEKVISERTAHLITDILTDNNARAPAFGANSELNITAKQFAVKTGTTNSLRDNWAIGYNDDYVVVTWIGNNNNEQMRNILSGYNGSSTIWREAIDYLIATREVKDRITVPANLVEVEVCVFTDTLPCQGCPVERRAYLRGEEPKIHCDSNEIYRMLQQQRDQNSEDNLIL